MSDSYTEVSNQSWFSRLGNSIKGILFGVLLLVGGLTLLFWNEGRAVSRTRALEEGQGAVLSVRSDAVDSTNEGKLVHLNGKALTTETLGDPIFGVTVNGLKLRRDVEMYQWKETSTRKEKKKLGGGTETKTTYDYSKTWSSGLNKSSSFKRPEGHQNPSQMEFEKIELSAQKVTLGSFRLGADIISQIGGYEDVAMSEEKLPTAIAERGQIQDSKTIYIGSDPLSPRVGDLKLRFSYVPQKEVSIVSRQIGDSFEPYTTSNGSDIQLVQTGLLSAEAMFKSAHDSNTLLTFMLRVVGVFMVIGSLSMILNPLVVVGDVIPLVGRILGAGVTFVSFIAGGAISLFVIAIAWIFYRPILGVSLIVAAFGLIYLVYRRNKKVSVDTMKVEPGSQQKSVNA